mgnify:CR=1 FL=1
MDNRYFMIDLPETEDAAYARIAEYCDEVEFLSEKHSSFVYDKECLLGTELEPLLPALVGEREGNSWGMRGKLYRFRMTEEVAALLKKYGLDSVIRFFGEKYRFENAALYRQGKKVYSCCSHEGLEDWADKAFAASLARLCRRARSAESAPLQGAGCTENRVCLFRFHAFRKLCGGRYRRHHSRLLRGGVRLSDLSQPCKNAFIRRNQRAFGGSGPLCRPRRTL